MIRRTMLAVALTVGTAASLAPAQTNTESTRTTSNSRQTRGMIKLGIFGVCALVGIGGWVAKKMKGE